MPESQAVDIKRIQFVRSFIFESNTYKTLLIEVRITTFKGCGFNLFILKCNLPALMLCLVKQYAPPDICLYLDFLTNVSLIS